MSVTVSRFSWERGRTVGCGWACRWDSFEADALYRRKGYQIALGNFAGGVFSEERANPWEFPLLADYRLPVRAVCPFVEVGYAPHLIHGSVSSDFITIFNTSLLPQPTYSHCVSRTNWPASQGIVVGGGLELRFGRMKLTPVRNTNWNNTAISGNYGDGPSW